jgi:hypothetical protein
VPELDKQAPFHARFSPFPFKPSTRRLSSFVRVTSLNFGTTAWHAVDMERLEPSAARRDEPSLRRHLV